MKKIILSISVGLVFSGLTYAQDIPQRDVSSLVVNNFKNSYPKANDVEWEKDGALYKVEFEIGLSKDYKAWYNASGQRVKFTEEIAKDKLPQNIKIKINTEFKGYRIDDVKKITSGKDISYSVELKKLKEEWKVVFDSAAKIVSKIMD